MTFGVLGYLEEYLTPWGPLLKKVKHKDFEVCKTGLVKAWLWPPLLANVRSQVELLAGGSFHDFFFTL